MFPAPPIPLVASTFLNAVDTARACPPSRCTAAPFLPRRTTSQPHAAASSLLPAQELASRTIAPLPISPRRHRNAPRRLVTAASSGHATSVGRACHRVGRRIEREWRICWGAEIRCALPSSPWSTPPLHCRSDGLCLAFYIAALPAVNATSNQPSAQHRSRCRPRTR